MKDLLNSQEFYELMQAYRHAHVDNQKNVCERFEAVKNFILEHVEDTSETDPGDEIYTSEYDGYCGGDFEVHCK